MSPREARAAAGLGGLRSPSWVGCWRRGFHSVAGGGVLGKFIGAEPQRARQVDAFLESGGCWAGGRKGFRPHLMEGEVSGGIRMGASLL